MTNPGDPMLLMSLLIFLVYCLVVCAIAYEAWKQKACGDMLIWFFFIAFVAGFVVELTVIGNIPSADGTRVVVRDNSPVVTYDCTDSTMTVSRQQYMENYIRSCRNSNESYGYCTDHARQLFCKPVINPQDLPKSTPKSTPKKDSL